MLAKEVETLMQGYFTYLLERKLNTPGIFKANVIVRGRAG